MGPEGSTQRCFIDPVLDPCPKWLTNVDKTATEHNSGGIEHVHQVGHANGYIGRKHVEKSQSISIVRLDAGAYMCASNGMGRASCSEHAWKPTSRRPVAGKGAEATARCIHLPWAFDPADMGVAVPVDDNVTGLAGEAVGPSINTTIEYEAGANSGAESDVQKIVDVTACAELMFGPGRCGRVIVYEGWQGNTSSK